jgi:hypothetical protein
MKKIKPQIKKPASAERDTKAKNILSQQQQQQQ